MKKLKKILNKTLLITAVSVAMVALPIQLFAENSTSTKTATENIKVENTAIENNEFSVTHLSQTEFITKVDADKSEEAKDTVVIDVRRPEEFAEGHVPSAINIPHADLLADPSLIDAYKGKDMVFYCRSGARAKKVTDVLTEKKTPGVFHLEGDFMAWAANGQKVEK